MSDLSWNDPSTIVGGGGLLAGIGAAVKVVLDWRAGHQTQRVNAEDQIRDDLLSEVQSGREEIVRLRQELAEARRELRAFMSFHQQVVEEWQAKYLAMNLELAALKGKIEAAKDAV